MKHSSQKGFSLIEVLLVVVIIGVVAALAVPALRRGIIAAENRNIHASMKTMKSTQALFFSQNQRFARLSELNTMQQGGFGEVVGDRLIRYGFIFEMTPLSPTDTQLKSGYAIGAYRNVGGQTWRFELTNEGLYRILPGPDED